MTPRTLVLAPPPVDERGALGPCQTMVLGPAGGPRIARGSRPRVKGLAPGSQVPLPPALGSLVLGYLRDPQSLDPGERTVARVLTVRLQRCSALGLVFRLPPVATYWDEFEAE